MSEALDSAGVADAAAIVYLSVVISVVLDDEGGGDVAKRRGDEHKDQRRM